jgi:RimJ/RimL family protein N-acetyltransferase
MRWWGDPAPLPSLTEIERDVAGRFADTESALYLIVETKGGEAVGRLDVMNIDARNRSAEIGLYVGETAIHGQGLGTDALMSACRYLFEQRGLHRVGLSVMTGNVRAIAIYERLGFRREGMLRAHLWVDGMSVDELVMSLLPGELCEVG